MNRRHLLKGMGAAAAASLWPGWLSEAFAGPPCGVLKGTVTLSAAIQGAHAALRPLLVFVIPKDDGLKWQRGQHFGEWLNFGTAPDLAPLSICDVVCAEMDAVRQLFPSAPADQVPAILAVDVARAPARIAVVLPDFAHEEVKALDRFADVPDRDEMTAEERQKLARETWQQRMDHVDGAITSCIGTTGKAVREAVFADAAAAKRQSDAAWDRLAASDREVARRILAGGDATPEQVFAVAPALSAAAMEGRGDSRLLQLLAGAARARYCDQRIPGSKWATQSGCGETVEGEDDNLVMGCGMGFVPRRSQRFLYFFTRSPYLPAE